MHEPRLEHAFDLRVEVGKPIEIGRRRIVPILGGTLEGSEIHAKVLLGGADYQIVIRTVSLKPRRATSPRHKQGIVFMSTIAASATVRRKRSRG
jgi:hypothetical protein